ncbi:hypothetical protein [Sphingobacterium detergens]|uniref:Uncharacterized protein n=1 Tax=Sphingobacterium detergens TaxID=1145106 RepID=A0A420B8H5_SPHD1|nr:hypothetical protein [Sphingobacterium detergens]RKE52983.1 hypothetical protein DFQ12_3230 [Sphingobacterium detergens]
MKISYFLLLLIFATLKVAGQTKADSIPFIAYWATGDSYNFTITKIQQQWQEDEPIKNVSTSFQATFTVLDSSDTGYRIKWAYDIDLSQFTNSDDSTANLIKGIAKDMVMEVTYKTDEVGQFVGLENLEEIKNRTLSIYSTISKNLEKSGKMSSEQTGKILQALNKIFSSKEMVEQMVAKDILLFHLPFGNAYPIADTLYYEDEFSNLFGNTALRADVQVYVKAASRDDNYCTIVQTSALNPEDAKTYFTNLFTQLGVNDKEMGEMIKTSTLHITDNKHLEYWYDPGVPYFVESNRQSILRTGDKKVKSVDITRIQYND